MQRIQSQQVIDQCVEGDDQAWRDLHQRYHGVAECFLRRMGLPATELEDACQEVFVQVFRYLPRFERRAEFQTWLYRLCLTQCSRSRRRRRIRNAVEWLLGRETSVAPVAAEPDWSDAKLVEKVGQVLERMKPMHREALVLYELEGLDGEAIARILGCPPGTVRRRLHYARTEFERLLRAENEEENP